MKIKFPKAAKILLLLPASFLAIYLAWYFMIIRNDLKYLFVFKHVFNSGPDYPPSPIVILTIVSFVALWMIILSVAGD